MYHHIVGLLIVALQNCLQSWVMELCATQHCLNWYNLVKGGWWVLVGTTMCCKLSGFFFVGWSPNPKLVAQQKQMQHSVRRNPKGGGRWRKRLLVAFVLVGIVASIWLFWRMNKDNTMAREEMLTNMCDERARMLQDQFNVSMNHVHALANLVSTFHHGKHPSAIDQVVYSSSFASLLGHGQINSLQFCADLCY